MQTLTETAEKTACYAVFCPASSCNEDVRHGKGSLQKERCRGSIKEILSSTKLPTCLSILITDVCKPSDLYHQPQRLFAILLLLTYSQTHCMLTGHCQVWVLSLGLAKFSRSSNTSSLGLAFSQHHLVSMPQPKTSALPVTSPSPPFRLSPILFP